MENIKALTSPIQQTVLPITNLGQGVPSIINPLRELSDDFSAVGRSVEAEELLLKAEELEETKVQAG